MAGMFYSLQEVAAKLGKTEEDVKQIVKEGRLREFRDGPNLLFKIDEVEALMSDTSIRELQKSSTPSQEQPESEEEEISLVAEPTDQIDTEADLTSADTTLANEGTSILGDTDQQTLEDTAGETKIVSEESSLEEIEEDVNLDSFGSGSGLLDLSLQADDTSLGGILDEIYSPEGEGAEAPEPVEGLAMEVAAEAEQMLSETEIATTQPEQEAPAMVQAYAEPEPDTLSNAFGFMLFLPLLAIVYTAIVVTAGFRNVIPNILEKIQGIIWYVMAGAVVAAVLTIGVGFALSGSKGGKVRKKPKAKKKTKKTVETAEAEAEPVAETDIE